jgi:hypothetical protein
MGFNSGLKGLKKWHKNWMSQQFRYSYTVLIVRPKSKNKLRPREGQIGNTQLKNCIPMQTQRNVSKCSCHQLPELTCQINAFCLVKYWHTPNLKQLTACTEQKQRYIKMQSLTDKNISWKQSYAWRQSTVFDLVAYNIPNQISFVV